MSAYHDLLLTVLKYTFYSAFWIICAYFLWCIVIDKFKSKKEANVVGLQKKTQLTSKEDANKYRGVLKKIGLEKEVDRESVEKVLDRSDINGKHAGEVLITSKEKVPIIPRIRHLKDGTFYLEAYEGLAGLILKEAQHILTRLAFNFPQDFPISELGYAEKISWRHDRKIRVHFFPKTKAVMERLKFDQLKIAAGLSRKLGNELVKADVTDLGDRVEINTKSFILSEGEIKRSLSYIRAYFGKKLNFIVQKEPHIYQALVPMPAKLRFANRSGIKGSCEYLENMDGFDELIAAAKEYWDKEKKLYWWFGQINDGVIKLKDHKMLYSMDEYQAIMVGGSTGSGKTQGTISMVSATMFIYKNICPIRTIISIGDYNTDWDVVAKYSSIKPVAKPLLDEPGLNQNREFKENVETFVQHRNKMQDLLKQNTDCANITDLRKKGFVLEELIVIADEWRKIAEMVDFSNNISKLETIANSYKDIAAVYRKYGIRLILATQDFKAASVHKDLMSNVNCKIIYKINADSIQYLENININLDDFDFQSFDRGEAVIYDLAKTECAVTKTKTIPIKFPYIGEFNEKEKVNYKDEWLKLCGTEMNHIPFDPDLVVTEGEVEFEKFDRVTQYKLVSAALKHEKFDLNLKVADLNRIEFANIIATITNDEIKNKDGVPVRIGLGLLNKNYLNDKLVEKIAAEKHDLDYYFILCADRTKLDKSIGEVPPNFLFLELNDFVREMNNEILDKRAGIIGNRHFFNNLSSHITRMNEILELGSDLGPSEAEANLSVDPNLITVENFKRIINLPGKTDDQRIQKGLAGELFLKNLFNRTGKFKSVERTEDQVKRGEIKIPNGQGDWGSDLIIITKDDKKINVQVKTWASEKITPKDVGYTVSSANVYNCTQSWFITTSSYTESATEFAIQSKGAIKLLGRSDIIKMINDLKDKESILEQTTEETKKLIYQNVKKLITESGAVKNTVPVQPSEPKKAGRPRTKPAKDPNAPKRAPGRPPKLADLALEETWEGDNGNQ
jgi:hypothetical protein